MRSSIKTFLLLLVISLIAGIIFLITHSKGDLVIFFDQHHSNQLDQIFRFITFLGDGIWFAILGVLLLFVRYAWSISLLVLGLLQLVIIQGLKRGVFGRVPRPAQYFKDTYELQSVEGVDIHHFNSFPSGHTATAFGIAFLIVILIKSGKSGTFLAFIIAALAGISRIYLGQHFLEDVLAGALLGSLSALLTGYFYEIFRAKNPDSKIFNSSLTSIIKMPGKGIN